MVMRSLLFSLVVAAPCSSLAAASLAAARPNVLVLFADDLGFNQLSIPGQPFGYSGVNGAIRTPHLAKFAAEGTTFMHWYSGFHVCTPSRASLMVSRTPSRARVCPGLQLVPCAVQPSGCSPSALGSFSLDYCLVNARSPGPRAWRQQAAGGSMNRDHTVLINRVASYQSTMACAAQTGRLPVRVGLGDGVLHASAVGGLQHNETTMAEAVSAVGYAAVWGGTCKYNRGPFIFAPSV